MKNQVNDLMLNSKTPHHIQSKSLGSDEKFSNYIKTIRKNRKTSKSKVQKAIKLLEKDVKSPTIPTNVSTFLAIILKALKGGLTKVDRC